MTADIPSDNWVASSKEKHRGTFSELDILLRALDRFFDIDNLPFARREIATRNFFDELSTVKDVILGVLGLLEIVIPEGRRKIYWFQKFAVTKYLHNKRKDAFHEELMSQDIPEKSLLLLYDSFINLKGIVGDILKSEHIPYLTFANIGEITGKNLRENSYFNPFRKDLNPDFDVIDNREVSRMVRSIRERETKKYVSMQLLYLFKFLRYLKFADKSNKLGSLSASFMIILLLRSEVSLFMAHAENISSRVSDKGLAALSESIAYQFSIESKRVFEQELKDPFTGKSSHHLKGKLENSNGILRNLSEQSILQIVRLFKSEVGGEEIFESFVTNLEQSLRLREDSLILHRFLVLMEKQRSEKERLQVFGAMRNFMLYFESFTFRLLRHDDYEEFRSFFEKVLAFRDRDISERNVARLMDRIHSFRIFVETCLRQLANRSELLDRPVERERIEASLRQYLP
ncbi:MAG TPA: hypothetical protein VEI96_11660 [Thermodesulfovibrionales bacterium]|nr:hypothetical protein [Thermodesulfovibrionales bacterium]